VYYEGTNKREQQKHVPMFPRNMSTTILLSLAITFIFPPKVSRYQWPKTEYWCHIIKLEGKVFSISWCY